MQHQKCSGWFKGRKQRQSKLNRALNKKFGNTKEEETLPPSSYTLYQNYPNPFNPVTTIKYDIPDVGTGLALSTVVLKIYDILGKEVATLVNEQQPAGRYQVAFDASNLASGVYIYKLQAGSFTNSKKMIMLK